jgi:two-component system LytT family sensor kinase
MDVAIGMLLGLVLVASMLAGYRLLGKPRPVLSDQSRAMQAALHAATATLPHLRRGLTAETAVRAAPHLHELTQAPALALADTERLLAFVGAGSDHHHAGDLMASLLRERAIDRLRVEPKLACRHPECPLRAAVVAPLVVRGERVGFLVALHLGETRLRPEDTRVVADAAALVSAQAALAELEVQEERLARAELVALRAQISPHFVYNALAAVAGFIHTRPEEARELLSEFAELIRYAFRAERTNVKLADELRYVETYLRLEQARFGDRLQIRIQVAPEVLQVVVPAFSLQPLVENAVRHGLEQARGTVHIEILGRDLGRDVELIVSDDGPGMDAARARAVMAGQAGGIGISNVDGRLRATFGPEYALQIDSEPGNGTRATMMLPKFRTGVRAA